MCNDVVQSSGKRKKGKLLAVLLCYYNNVTVAFYTTKHWQRHILPISKEKGRLQCELDNLHNIGIKKKDLPVRLLLKETVRSNRDTQVVKALNGGIAF